MVTIKTNIPFFIDAIGAKLNKIRDKEYLLRPVATEVIPLMTERIHQKGLDKDGNEIGEYNNRYLKLRQKKYKRSSDKKIVVSLTRQLENDWHVIATEKGYGIGFLNTFNLEKARYVEMQKGRKIFFLSDSELSYAQNRIKELVDAAINQ